METGKCLERDPERELFRRESSAEGFRRLLLEANNIVESFQAASACLEASGLILTGNLPASRWFQGQGPAENRLCLFKILLDLVCPDARRFSGPKRNTNQTGGSFSSAL